MPISKSDHEPGLRECLRQVSGHSWRVFLICLIGVTFANLDHSLFTFVLTELSAEFGWSDLERGSLYRNHLCCGRRPDHADRCTRRPSRATCRITGQHPADPGVCNRPGFCPDDSQPADRPHARIYHVRRAIAGNRDSGVRRVPAPPARPVHGRSADRLSPRLLSRLLAGSFYL